MERTKEIRGYCKKTRKDEGIEATYQSVVCNQWRDNEGSHVEYEWKLAMARGTCHAAPLCADCEILAKFLRKIPS